MEIFKTQKYNDYVIIISLYFVSYGIYLFDKGIFWDDWIYFTMDRATLLDHFHQFGNVYIGYFYEVLFSNNYGVSLSRVIVFGSFLLSALFLYNVLEDLPFIDRASRTFIVLIFSIFPVNTARIAVSCSIYAIGYAAFFCGTWLISKYVESRRRSTRITALAAFLLSFLVVNSTLVFYAIPLLYLLYLERKGKGILENSLIVVRNNADFFLLPLMAWIIRYRYFMPYGLYSDYNIISLHNITFRAFGQTGIYILNIIIQSLLVSTYQLLLVTALIFLFVVIAFKGQRANTTDNGCCMKLLLVGLIFFGLGIFPYIVVGKTPMLNDWGSRHALLLPLGLSFILYYILTVSSSALRLNPNVKIIILSVILASFVSYNISIYTDFQLDWYKQESLIFNLKECKCIRDHTTFLFEDRTRDLNADNREYRFYEYTSMMKYVFGDEKRFGCDYSAFTSISDYWRYSTFGFREYAPMGPPYLVIIDYGESYRDSIAKKWTLHELLFRDLLSPMEVEKELHKIIRLECKELPPNHLDKS